MNLLNDFFNIDDFQIVGLNKKYLLLTIVIVILIMILLLIKKDYYYQNSFDIKENGIVLLVEKEYINKLKDAKEIDVDGIKCGYNINQITPLEMMYLVNISLNTEIGNMNSGNYKVLLGKERIVDYIVRIIKK